MRVLRPGADKVWLLFRELRAPFFTASLVPAALGIALAHWRTGTVDLPLAWLTMLGVLAIHAGANTANDYFDHRSGNDEVNTRYIRPFTGGSRLIQEGLLAPREVLVLSLACFLAGMVVAAFIVWRTGWPVILPAALGALCGYAYTAPPLKLGYRGWGEPAIALAFGLLPVAGAYYVQTRNLDASVLLAALPVTLLVTAILFVNQFPDYLADKLVDKRHWVVRLGPRAARLPYAMLMLGWAPALAAGVITGALPPASLFALLALLPCAIALVIVWRHFDDESRLAPASLLTVLSHLLVGLVTVTALFL